MGCHPPWRDEWPNGAERKPQLPCYITLLSHNMLPWETGYFWMKYCVCPGYCRTLHSTGHDSFPGTTGFGGHGLASFESRHEPLEHVWDDHMGVWIQDMDDLFYCSSISNKSCLGNHSTPSHWRWARDQAEIDIICIPFSSKWPHCHQMTSKLSLSSPASESFL